MVDMVCSHPDCMEKALSRLPLMYGKNREGEMPICHEAVHVVWAGGECHDFGEMDDAGRQEYLQRLEDTLKQKILDKMEIMG